MSQQIGEVRTGDRVLSVTSFWGGVNRGPSLQITEQGLAQERDPALNTVMAFVQLDACEVRDLVAILHAWLAERGNL